ncbi:MAG: glycerophosphodiester phosphodiesterase [Actinomycetes bacterium]
MTLIFAHRGYSARQPEMTRAAFVEAIAWSARTRVPLGLECDVHLSADSQLICLHDLSVDRTSDGRGLASTRTVAQLRALDFGSWRVRRPTRDQRSLVTLPELLALVAEARAAGIEVSLAIETKHPNSRGLELEDRVAALLASSGWDRAGAPVRLISFAPDALGRLGRLLPELERTFLLRTTFGPWVDGHLPAGVRVVGLELALLRADPGYVDRVRARGHSVHAWTVNTRADVDYCRGLGVTGLTTDDPEVAAGVLAA